MPEIRLLKQGKVVAKLSLLEQAKAVNIQLGRKPREFNHDEIELALGWLSDEVTISQVSSVLGSKSHGAALYRMAVALREAYRAGILKIKS
jgi:hypothetical protein